MRDFLAFTIACFTVAFPAMAQQYTCTVLYPLTLPDGVVGGAGLALGPQSSIASQTVGLGTLGDGSVAHAFLWSAPSGSATDLNPSDFTKSTATTSDGTQQVGYAYDSATTGSEPQAMLWSGTAASAVDLNPAGFDSSVCFGVAADFEVGEGSTTGNNEHALLWNSTAASAVDLNPAAFDNSQALGIAGNQEVGDGSGSATGNDQHALLWNGTAASAVDLNPAGYTFSEAIGVSGNQQVGAAGFDSSGANPHAMLWNGIAASAVDLSPTNLTGISNSTALATNGAEQVGFGQLTTQAFEAIVWSGTAASAVNLQPLLPSDGTWAESWASYIDTNGNVFGYAQGTLNGVSGEFAIEWSTPEPASISALAIGMLGLLRRRRAHR